MLTLYYYRAACSLASMIGMEECGEPYRAVEVDLAGDRSAYFHVNPEGKVPAIVDGDVLLTDNVAILYWLARRHPDLNLLPADPMAAAQCLSHMAWFGSAMHPTRRQNSAPFRLTPDKSVWPALKEAAHARYWQQQQSVDQKLAGKTWLMGDQYTVADGYALLFYHWGVADNLPMAELAHFSAFKDRMLARPAVVRALQKHNSPLLA